MVNVSGELQASLDRVDELLGQVVVAGAMHAPDALDELLVLGQRLAVLGLEALSESLCSLSDAQNREELVGGLADIQHAVSLTRLFLVGSQRPVDTAHVPWHAECLHRNYAVQPPDSAERCPPPLQGGQNLSVAKIWGVSEHTQPRNYC